MKTVIGFLLVFVGGGLGAALRHGINQMAARLVGTTFPYGTLFINVVGSMMMGFIIEYFALKGNLPQRGLLFLTTGILGGFTTFSTFSLETALLYERGQIAYAAVYVLASVGLGIGALFAAIAIVRATV
jgi:fluoride exporter